MQCSVLVVEVPLDAHLTDLGYADHHRNAQRQGYCQVLFGHSYESSVASDDEDDTGGRSRCQSVQGGFQISLVPSQVYKAYSKLEAQITNFDTDR